MLRVAKVLNNNIAIVVDSRGNDCIAMGRGVAFGRKHGDLIDENDVERLFTQHVDELSGKLGQLVKSIPEEYFEATQAIVEHAKLRMGRDLDDGIYLALTDHIHFAVERARKGQALDNRLNFEIKMVYPDEYACAKDCYRIHRPRFQRHASPRRGGLYSHAFCQCRDRRHGHADRCDHG